MATAQVPAWSQAGASELQHDQTYDGVSALPPALSLEAGCRFVELLAGSSLRPIAGLIWRAVQANPPEQPWLQLARQCQRLERPLRAEATPKRLFALPWEYVDLWWVDERTVPSEHDDSNYRMARETLIEPLKV